MGKGVVGLGGGVKGVWVECEPKPLGNGKRFEVEMAIILLLFH